MTTCPSCDGEKKVLVFADGHRADGTAFHSNGHRACSLCGGTGTIADAHAQRIAAGKLMRDARVSMGMSLLEGARLAGMTPAELSAIENGRPSPTSTTVGGEGS